MQNNFFSYYFQFGFPRSPFQDHPLAKQILNPIDMDIVTEKVTDDKYRSLNDFMADIQWISHNYYIVDDGK